MQRRWGKCVLELRTGSKPNEPRRAIGNVMQQVRDALAADRRKTERLN